MIVHDGDIGGAMVGPAEDDSPLVIDADGVKGFQVAFEGFQTIAGRNFHIVQVSRLIELNELAKGDPRNGVEASALLVAEELLCLGILEGLNHLQQSLADR